MTEVGTCAFISASLALASYGRQLWGHSDRQRPHIGRYTNRIPDAALIRAYRPSAEGLCFLGHRQYGSSLL